MKIQIFFVFEAKTENIAIPSKTTFYTGNDLKEQIFSKFDISDHKQILLQANGELVDTDKQILFSEKDNNPKTFFLYSLSHLDSGAIPDQRLEKLINENASSKQLIEFFNVLKTEASLLNKSLPVLSNSYRENNIENAQLVEKFNILNTHLEFFRNSKFEKFLRLTTKMPVLPALIDRSVLPDENPTLFDVVKSDELNSVDSIKEYVNSLISQCDSFKFDPLDEINKLYEEAELSKDDDVVKTPDFGDSINCLIDKITLEMPNDLPNSSHNFIRGKYNQTMESIETTRKCVQESCRRLIDIQSRLGITNAHLSGFNDRFERIKQITDAPAMYMSAVKETIRRTQLKMSVNLWTSSILEQGSKVSSEETERRKHIRELFGDHFLSGLFVHFMETRVPQISSVSPVCDENLPEIDINDLFELEKIYNLTVFEAEDQNIENSHTSYGESITEQPFDGDISLVSMGETPLELGDTFSTKKSEYSNNLMDSSKLYVSFSTNISVGNDILVIYANERFRIIAKSCYILHRSSAISIKDMVMIELPNATSYSAVCQVINQKIVVFKSSKDNYKKGDKVVMIYAKAVSIHKYINGLYN